MRGYPERTLATRAKWLLDTREDVEVSATEWVEEMEEILKELANAPEPSPFVWWSDADDVVFESLRNGKHLPFDQRNAYLSAVEISSALPLYTAPPAPSVPDEQLQAAFDRGLKAGNEQSVAQQIEIHKLRNSLVVQQQEPTADLVRDAERYRWLRTYNTAKHPAVTEAFFLGDENLDAEIDAAIAAEKGTTA